MTCTYVSTKANYLNEKNNRREYLSKRPRSQETQIHGLSGDINKFVIKFTVCARITRHRQHQTRVTSNVRNKVKITQYYHARSCEEVNDVVSKQYIRK